MHSVSWEWELHHRDTESTEIVRVSTSLGSLTSVSHLTRCTYAKSPIHYILFSISYFLSPKSPLPSPLADSAILCYIKGRAGVAQVVEHLPSKQMVARSSRVARSTSELSHPLWWDVLFATIVLFLMDDNGMKTNSVFEPVSKNISYGGISFVADRFHA